MRNKDNDKTRVQFMAFPMCNDSSTHFMEGKKGTLKKFKFMYFEPLLIHIKLFFSKIIQVFKN